MTANPHPMLCAWCLRVRTGSGRWVERELDDNERAEATHGICPDCLEQETLAACAAFDCP